ncbi:MAG: phosphate ABC transporter permease subunit PstC [Anaerolineaceae bacterium]|jgi:phosphate transport system permease protein
MQVLKSKQSGQSKLLLSQDTRRREGWIAFVFKASAVLTILVTIGIIVSLLSETLGFFARPEVSLWKFLTGTRWQPLASKPTPENFGILPLVAGTLLVAGVAALLAVPVGLGTAIFLSEYASDKLRGIIKPVLEILAGVPSVVYGFFAISFITPIIKTVFETWLGMKVMFFNALSAGLVVGIMIIPMIASVSEDSMRAVPRSLREAAYAVGATKFEVATKVVVPAALSGIVAAFILAISRAIGETMAVSIAAGSTPIMTLNPLNSVQTLTAFIVQVSFGDAAAGSINSQSIYAVGMTLFVMTFIMNLISDLVLRKFREVYE